MHTAAIFFITAGVVSLFWSTVLPPIFGGALEVVFRRRDRAFTRVPTRTLDILVAAHNEEQVIASTLQSLLSSARTLDDLKISIAVGCDHCTDRTVAIVEEIARVAAIPVRALENSGSRGKWNVLNTLVEQSQAEWVALVDCGSIWNEGLLARVRPLLDQDDIMGIAPSYAAQKSGLLETANWRLERFLKKLENAAGGPVSVHGASVLYRREPLVRALKTLAGQEWLNDDVAIPLTLRLQNQLRLVYLADGAEPAWVSDLGVKSELAVEYRRRRRMLIGNLQWVKLLLAPAWATRPLVTVIASRRIFRMLWAYWVLLASVGVCLLLGANHLLSVGACLTMGSFVACVFAASNWTRRLLMAFVSGLQLPRYWKDIRRSQGSERSDMRRVVWL